MDKNQEKEKTELEQVNITALVKAWKWAMFIAVLGFIATGVLLIVGIIAMAFLCIFNKGASSSTLTAWLGSSFIIAAGVSYFFPVLYLFRFSKNMRDIKNKNDKQLLTKAFSNLRSCFTWFGILVIIGIVLYVVTFLILGASVTFLKDIM